MRLGWVHDEPTYLGGAQMNREAIAEAMPAGYELTDCTRRKVQRDVDAYVIWNCTQFNSRLIDVVEDKPIIKVVSDVWPFGDVKLRSWLMQHSRAMVLVSPPLLDWLPEEPQCPVEYVPSVIDTSRFYANEDRQGTVWLGRMFPGKGLGEAVRWATKTETHVDFYGFGPDTDRLQFRTYCHFEGQVPYEQVPDVLARYETFVFLPTDPDPCPRAVIEAWAAKMRLVVNANVGATWWIQNAPETLRRAGEHFWDVMEQYLT